VKDPATPLRAFRAGDLFVPEAASAPPTQRTLAVLEGMAQAFEFFEAVPKELWWDDPKTVATAIFRGRIRQHNRQYVAPANQLEATQRKSGLDRLLGKLDKLNLLIVDVSGGSLVQPDRGGFLVQVITDRYERRSLLITSNLAFSDWGQIFQGERMMAALLDWLPRHCHLSEMNGESRNA